MNQELSATVARLLPEAEAFLCTLIRFESVPGSEQDAMEFCARVFSLPGVAVERIPLSNAIKNDPDYSTPVPGIEYDGRCNLRVVRRGSGGGRKLILNAHADVVPASEGMGHAFSPRVENGIVYGRGACDDKGQVAVLWLLFKTLDALNITTAGDLVVHIVVEEENGGNGTLAMVRTGETADGCVVLEASEGKLFTSIRGAIWFRVEFHGTAGHSGQVAMTKSALLIARDAIAALEKFHADLLAGSRGLPLFDPYPNPMPLTFGKLHAGNWPAAAPSLAVLEGVLGFLPNKTKEQVMDGMRKVLEETCAGGFDLSFLYRHDSSVIPADHAFPRTILSAAEAVGHPLEVDAMTASCDAWFYNNQLGIPTVVYGAGTLKVAHSKDEQIPMQEIGNAAEVLVRLAIDFSQPPI